MFCLFHEWKLMNLCYEEYCPPFDNYGLKVVEVYKCSKCKCIKYKTVNKFRNIYSTSHNKIIDSLRKDGAISTWELKLRMIKKTKS